MGSYLHILTFGYGTRDALNRMQNRAVVVGGSTISNEIYGYDNMNRLTSTDRTEDAKRDAFTYDYESQMTNAQYGLVNGINPNRTVGYTLDLVGNRTNVNDGGIGYTYTPNNINQYASAGADAIGNGSEHEITDYKGVTYGYINDGRLKTVNSTGNAYVIAYDAFGRTVSRTLNNLPTTYYYYDGEKAIVETGGTTASNVYGLGVDEIVLRFETADTKFFYQDHEGSVTHVRNNAGVMIESYRYDAFGAPTILNSSAISIPQSAIGNRFMFTGREWNATFGFYEYRARAYHPVLGRFMSEDPKGFDAGDYNLFRYCGNDPEDRVDPMGLADFAVSPGSLATSLTSWTAGEGAHGGGSTSSVSQAGGGNDAGAAEAQPSQTGSESAKLSVRAEINHFPGGSENGVKLIHTVGLQRNGTFNVRTFAGNTHLGAIDFKGSFQGLTFVVPIKGCPGSFNVILFGHATSTPLMMATGRIGQVMFSIHYAVKFTVNFAQHTAFSDGRVSSYPTFTGRINGHTMFHHDEGRPLVGLLPGREVSATGQSDNW